MTYNVQFCYPKQIKVTKHIIISMDRIGPNIGSEIKRRLSLKIPEVAKLTRQNELKTIKLRGIFCP